MPGTRTLIAAALAGAISLGTLAGATIPARMKSASGPDWRDTYGAAPALDGQDYYIEPSPQDLSPPLATMSWLDSEPGAVSDTALAPYTYDGDELADDAALMAVDYEPSPEGLPAGSANASADDQAAAAQEVAEAVRQAEAEGQPRPATAS